MSPFDPVVVKPIGVVRGGRKEPTDDQWDNVEARIELDGLQFGADALAGLNAFSHIEVVFHFHLVPDNEICAGARRPRGCQDWPAIGIFAQRGKGRPNRMAVSVCRLVRVDGLAVHVRMLDAIDGTPVLDIKPLMRGFLPRGEIREPAWAAEIMKEYW